MGLWALCHTRRVSCTGAQAPGDRDGCAPLMRAPSSLCLCLSLLLLESRRDKEPVWFPAGSSVIKEMSSTTSRLDSKLASGDAYPLGLPKSPLCHPGKICSLPATTLIPRHTDWEGELAGTESSAQNGTKCSQQNYPTELALHPAGIASEE